MPIYNAPITALDKTEVLRYAGFRGETPFPNALLEEACTEALTLTKPQGIWNIYKYDAATHMILSQPSFCLASNNLTHHLEKAIEIAIMTITIGSELETKASASFTDGNYTLGLLLDAAGTAAVETAADALNKLITTVSAKRGLKTLWRFSPGYGDWNITNQPQILKLSDGHLAGVSVTSTCMLLPRKSVTAVIGLVPAEKELSATQQQNNNSNCQICQKQNCIARKEPNK